MSTINATRTNESISIANTILEQIGRWNIAAFGVPPKSIMALSENEFRLGGVMFKFTNCPKIRSGTVIVELMPSDTYTVSILSPLKIVLAKREQIYCDQLFDYLDVQIG
jgi:hypothetical protein